VAEASTAPDLSYRALLAVPRFGRLVGATLLVRAAASMWQLALVLFVLERYGSPTLAGLSVFLSIAPGIVLSPLAGAMLDRYGRVRLMVADYGVSAIALLGIVVLARLGAPFALVLGCVVVSSMLTPLGASGSRSLMPLVVPRQLWDRANAIDSMGYTLTAIVAPPLAGAIVAFSSPEAAIAVTAGVYLVGALALAGVGEVLVPRRRMGPLLVEAGAGVGYVLRHPSLRGLAAGISVMNLGQGILLVALPVLAFDRLHADATLVGGLWAVMGASGLVTGLLVGRWGSSGRERGLMIAGMVGVGAGLAILAIATSVPVVVASVVIIGAATGPTDIALFSLRQRVTDPAWFGRAFAVSMHLNYSGVPIGSAISGPLLALSITGTLGIAVAFLALAAGLTYVLVPPSRAAA